MASMEEGIIFQVLDCLDKAFTEFKEYEQGMDSTLHAYLELNGLQCPPWLQNKSLCNLNIFGAKPVVVTKGGPTKASEPAKACDRETQKNATSKSRQCQTRRNQEVQAIEEEKGNKVGNPRTRRNLRSRKACNLGDVGPLDIAEEGCRNLRNGRPLDLVKEGCNLRDEGPLDIVKEGCNLRDEGPLDIAKEACNQRDGGPLDIAEEGCCNLRDGRPLDIAKEDCNLRDGGPLDIGEEDCCNVRDGRPLDIAEEGCCNLRDGKPLDIVEEGCCNLRDGRPLDIMKEGCNLRDEGPLDFAKEACNLRDGGPLDIAKEACNLEIKVEGWNRRSRKACNLRVGGPLDIVKEAHNLRNREPLDIAKEACSLAIKVEEDALDSIRARLISEESQCVSNTRKMRRTGMNIALHVSAISGSLSGQKGELMSPMEVPLVVKIEEDSQFEVVNLSSGEKELMSNRGTSQTGRNKRGREASCSIVPNEKSPLVLSGPSVVKIEEDSQFEVVNPSSGEKELMSNRGTSQTRRNTRGREASFSIVLNEKSSPVLSESRLSDHSRDPQSQCVTEALCSNHSRDLQSRNVAEGLFCNHNRDLQSRSVTEALFSNYKKDMQSQSVTEALLAVQAHKNSDMDSNETILGMMNWPCSSNMASKEQGTLLNNSPLPCTTPMSPTEVASVVKIEGNSWFEVVNPSSGEKELMSNRGTSQTERNKRGQEANSSIILNGKSPLVLSESKLRDHSRDPQSQCVTEALCSNHSRDLQSRNVAEGLFCNHNRDLQSQSVTEALFSNRRRDLQSQSVTEALPAVQARKNSDMDSNETILGMMNWPCSGNMASKEQGTLMNKSPLPCTTFPFTFPFDLNILFEEATNASESSEQILSRHWKQINENMLDSKKRLKTATFRVGNGIMTCDRRSNSPRKKGIFVGQANSYNGECLTPRGGQKQHALTESTAEVFSRTEPFKNSENLAKIGSSPPASTLVLCQINRDLANTLPSQSATKSRKKSVLVESDALNLHSYSGRKSTKPNMTVAEKGGESETQVHPSSLTCNQYLDTRVPCEEIELSNRMESFNNCENLAKTGSSPPAGTSVLRQEESDLVNSSTIQLGTESRKKSAFVEDGALNLLYFNGRESTSFDVDNSSPPNTTVTGKGVSPCGGQSETPVYPSSLVCNQYLDSMVSCAEMKVLNRTESFNDNGILVKTGSSPPASTLLLHQVNWDLVNSPTTKSTTESMKKSALVESVTLNLHSFSGRKSTSLDYSTSPLNTTVTEKGLLPCMGQSETCVHTSSLACNQYLDGIVSYAEIEVCNRTESFNNTENLAKTGSFPPSGTSELCQVNWNSVNSPNVQSATEARKKSALVEGVVLNLHSFSGRKPTSLDVDNTSPPNTTVIEKGVSPSGGGSETSVHTSSLTYKQNLDAMFSSAEMKVFKRTESFNDSENLGKTGSSSPAITLLPCQVNQDLVNSPTIQSATESRKKSALVESHILNRHSFSGRESIFLDANSTSPLNTTVTVKGAPPCGGGQSETPIHTSSLTCNPHIDSSVSCADIEVCNRTESSNDSENLVKTGSFPPASTLLLHQVNRDLVTTSTTQSASESRKKSAFVESVHLNLDSFSGRESTSLDANSTSLPKLTVIAKGASYGGPNETSVCTSSLASNRYLNAMVSCAEIKDRKSFVNGGLNELDKTNSLKRSKTPPRFCQSRSPRKKKHLESSIQYLTRHSASRDHTAPEELQSSPCENRVTINQITKAISCAEIKGRKSLVNGDLNKSDKSNSLKRSRTPSSFCGSRSPRKKMHLESNIQHLTSYSASGDFTAAEESQSSPCENKLIIDQLMKTSSERKTGRDSPAGGLDVASGGEQLQPFPLEISILFKQISMRSSLFWKTGESEGQTLSTKQFSELMDCNLCTQKSDKTLIISDSSTNSKTIQINDALLGTNSLVPCLKMGSETQTDKEKPSNGPKGNTLNEHGHVEMVPGLKDVSEANLGGVAGGTLHPLQEGAVVSPMKYVEPMEECEIDAPVSTTFHKSSTGFDTPLFTGYAYESCSDYNGLSTNVYDQNLRLTRKGSPINLDLQCFRIKEEVEGKENTQPDVSSSSRSNSKFSVKKGGRGSSTNRQVLADKFNANKIASVSDADGRPFNLVANVRSFLPLVQQKQATMPYLNEKREVKVKALQAAVVAKRLEEKREQDRRMRKLELAKAEKEKLMMQLKCGLEHLVSHTSLGIQHIDKVVGDCSAKSELLCSMKNIMGVGSLSKVNSIDTVSDVGNSPRDVLARVKHVAQMKQKLEQEKAKRQGEDQMKKEQEWKMKEVRIVAKKRERVEAEKKKREEKRKRVELVQRLQKEEEERQRFELGQKEERRKALEECEQERKTMEEEAKRHRRIEREKEAERHRRQEQEAKAILQANKELRKKKDVSELRPRKLADDGYHKLDKILRISAVSALGEDELKGGKSGALAAYHPPPLPDVEAATTASTQTTTFDEGTIESYEIPSDRSSSDDEDEDEEENCTKPIPIWARNENVMLQLLRQQDVDPDIIFSSAKTCSLQEIFGTIGSIKCPDFTKRRGSGDWSEDCLTWKEQIEYKKSMGYIKPKG